MTADSRLRLRQEELEWREVEGQIVVLDVRASVYLQVNATGRIAWSALVDGATRDELIGRVTSAYDVDPARAAADVDAFIEELRQRDLLCRDG